MQVSAHNGTASQESYTSIEWNGQLQILYNVTGHMHWPVGQKNSEGELPHFILEIHTGHNNKNPKAHTFNISLEVVKVLAIPGIIKFNPETDLQASMEKKKYKLDIPDADEFLQAELIPSKTSTSNPSSRIEVWSGIGKPYQLVPETSEALWTSNVADPHRGYREV